METGRRPSKFTVYNPVTSPIATRKTEGTAGQTVHLRGAASWFLAHQDQAPHRRTKARQRQRRRNDPPQRVIIPASTGA